MRQLLAMSAVLLAALMMSPTAAQEPDGAKVTFRLTLYGKAPDRESFRLGLSVPGQMGEETQFCGTASYTSVCEGGGRTYTLDAKTPRSSALTYFFLREIELRPGEILFKQFVGKSYRLTDDGIISAYFEYDGLGRPLGGGIGNGPHQGANQRGDKGGGKNVPDKLPKVGVGGLVGVPLLGDLVALLSL